VFVVASFYCIKFLNKELTPSADQSVFIVRYRMPIGSSLAYTDEATKKAEAWFRKQQEVAHVYAAIGGLGSAGAASASDANSGMMFITMKDKGERGKNPEYGHELKQNEFMNEARTFMKTIPGMEVFMMDLSQRGFGTGKGYPIEYILTGPDWETLAKYQDILKDEMRKSGMMTDVDSDYLAGMP